MRGLLAALLLSAALTAAAADGPPVAAQYTVRIDPRARTLGGEALLQVVAGRHGELELGPGFRIESLSIDGQSVDAPQPDAHGTRWRFGASGKPRRIELRWSGMLAPLDTGLDHRQTLTEVAPVAGDAGVFLPSSSGWHPQIAGLAFSYRVALEIGGGQRGLVAGRLLQEEEYDGAYRAHFDFPHPADGIDLMAGPYRIEERWMRGASDREIRLRTWFHPELAQLAAAYLDSVQEYVRFYESWIGPYPYSDFSVVSSPTPTGFGMPTLTYLGINVLKLPFIRGTSLGHEVLHNWWGNGVYPDYASGNWSEGLTTYMADYAYKEREGEDAAAEMRLGWLRDLSALPPGEDRPLREFTSRTHTASQIVGYHKAAMVFEMLRDMLGREVFDAGLRRFWRDQQFRVAGWDDLRRAFEQVSGRPLADWLAQWLARPGIPAPRIVRAERVRGSDAWQVRVELAQDAAQPYRMRVPLQVRGAGGAWLRHVELSGARGEFLLASDGEPLSVALDPELRLLRRLGPDEAPPILRQIQVAAEPRLVTLSSDAQFASNARALAERMLDRPARPAAGGTPPAGGAVVVGRHDEVDAYLLAHGLAPRPDEAARRGTAQVWVVAGPAGACAVISVEDAAALAALVRPLPHYGRQSWLVFEGSRAAQRGVWPARLQEVRVEDGASRAPAR